MYDFSFELPELSSASPLPIALLDDQCTERETVSELELPLHHEPEGILCRPAHRYAVSETSCGGRLHKPCGGNECAEAPEAQCDEGLACQEIAAGDLRCMKTCSADEECPLGGALRCDEGLCRLRESF